MATKFGGYMGKVMDVDLTTGSIGEYPLTDEDRELFLGGRFLATKILLDVLPPGVDPLGPDNVVVVMTSPLTGSGAPSTSRYDISAKSPLTGLICHSNSGGNFGVRLKRTGWDGMVIRGRAPKPVYIEIGEEKVQIKSAEKIWGMNTHDAQNAMGKGGKMVIGPAGENQVLYASVVSQERSHGRGGMGAVFGSKNLKGMAAQGRMKIPIHDQESFRDLTKKWAEQLRKHPATGDFMPKYGTAGFLQLINKGNALPTKNFSVGTYPHADKIGGEELTAKYLVKNVGCESCPIRCGRVVNIDGKEVKGPEYEILCLLGSNLEQHDLELINRWNYILDLLGMDAISASNVICFAAELNEKGLWKNGIEFGKADNITRILEDIAYRRGMGDDLAQGVRLLSKKYGGEDFAIHVKGMEIPAYEPRACVGHGLGYATASRGGCHLDAGYIVYFEVNGPIKLDPLHYRSKAGWAVFNQNLMSAISAGGNCLFTVMTVLPPQLFKLPEHPMLSSVATKVLTATWPSIEMSVQMPKSLMSFNVPLIPHPLAIKLATGMKMDLGRFLAVGDRGYTLDRIFNIREGLRNTDDTLPKRFLKETLGDGKRSRPVPLHKMLPRYYKLRGWDANGVPTAKTLKKLSMNFVNADQLRSWAEQNNQRSQSV